jgi:2-(1,2-epoxy-1,2-dihydrophenyl)acetyl-CoA isomerase
VNDLVLSSHNGSLGIITLNNPRRHNSLTPPFLQALLHSLAAVPETSRALLLQANGRSFSTGGDVKGFYDHLDDLADYANELVSLLNQVILAMLDYPIPIVTAVHGILSGGSLGLVLASDIVLVTPEASFTPYYNVVGFSPDGGWASWLPTIIGPRRTAESLLCNRTISARDAVDWGMAVRLVDATQIQAAAKETANRIASMKPGSIGHTRQMLNANRSLIAHGLEREKRHFVQQVTTPEARQGILDFVANSRPNS